MSKFKRIIIWSSIALTVNSLALLSIDKYFWKAETNFTLKKVDASKGLKKISKIKIPEAAKNMAVSFNGEFLSYYLENRLTVVNNYSGEEEKVDASTGYEITYYKWMPDRNNLVIGEKQTGNGSTIKFSGYDPKKKSKKDYVNTDGNLVKLKLPDGKAKVEAVAMSMNNGSFYFRLNQYGKSSVYFVNIMSQMNKVSNIGSKIGDIAMMQNETKLLYDDLTTNKVRITGKNSINVKGESKLTILGVDSQDIVYLGAKSGDKITKIYYGEPSKGSNGWKSVALPVSCNKDDIYVLNNGKYYMNDGLKGAIIDLSTGKEVSYKGTLLQVFPKGIATIEDGLLKITEF